MDTGRISIKSKYDVEFRRYALKINDVQSFDKFHKKIELFHQLEAIPFVIFYTDPEDNDSFLPINNDDNLAKAISSAKTISLRSNNKTLVPNSNGSPHTIYNAQQIHNQSQQHQHMQQQFQQQQQMHHHHYLHHHQIIRRPFLKLIIAKKEVYLHYFNNGKQCKKSQPFKGFSILPSSNEQNSRPSIGMPEDFRQVSSIIDVDIVPETCRRVRLVKHGSDKPLGFYIRDGTYKRFNAQGQVEIVNGIFISRLIPGGLAESTGLLAVNDEVLEVNGIEVTHGKTLDQVTDMMVANSKNLIITIRPAGCNCRDNSSRWSSN